MTLILKNHMFRDLYFSLFIIKWCTGLSQFKPKLTIVHKYILSRWRYHYLELKRRLVDLECNKTQLEFNCQYFNICQKKLYAYIFEQIIKIERHLNYK